MVHRKITVCSPAKVNLFLGVGERGVDGYHELETILQCLDLCDILTFELHDEGAARGLVSLTCDPSLEIPQENNLAYRATVAFIDTFGRDVLPEGSGISMHIDKNIPSQAGFGGGSSNAAAALLACAKVWGVDPLGDDCLSLARSLGADVPFFLYGGCAYMVGRGDIMRARIEPLDAQFVLLRSDDKVSTAAAYAAFDEKPRPADPLDDMKTAIMGFSADRSRNVARVMSNNLEDAAKTLSPALGGQLAWLAERDGVSGCLLSGSGSGVFAIVETDEHATRIADAARERGYWVRVARAIRKGVEILSDEQE